MSSRQLLWVAGMDDSVGTYVTDYMITGQVWAQAIYLIYREKPISFDIRNRTYSSSLFFLFMGLATLMGGITHQYYPHDHLHDGTPTGYYVFWIQTLIFLLSLQFSFSFNSCSHRLFHSQCTKFFGCSVVWCRWISCYLFLLMVGPITECCCCKSVQKEARNQWLLFGLIAFVVSLPFQVMALKDLAFLFGTALLLLAALYFIPKAIMDLRKSKRSAGGCKWKPEYLYIINALLMLIAMAVYLPFSAGCSKNEYGYSSNSEDDNYCPFWIDFNHNAILHCIQMLAMFALFLGVLLEAESKRGKIVDDSAAMDYQQLQYPL